MPAAQQFRRETVITTYTVIGLDLWDVNYPSTFGPRLDLVRTLPQSHTGSGPLKADVLRPKHKPRAPDSQRGRAAQTPIRTRGKNFLL